MAEFTANAIQTVTENQNVIFTDTVVCGSNCIMHRGDSGLITLKGATNQCRAKFKIFFNGNVSIPSTGAADAISLSVALDGEPINSTSMISTPAAVELLNNISTGVIVEVVRGYCATVSIKNTSTQAINVQNANIIVERVA